LDVHEHEKYPALAILVKGGFACVHYFPAVGDPGFLSVGNMSALECRPTVTFATGGTPFEVSTRSILRFADALQVAKEFLRSKELPKSIGWLRLCQDDEYPNTIA
jgi:hypothetical protein